MISIVSPIYRAEKILPELVSEIDSVMQKIGQDYEIILVDDRSPDNSWEVMKTLYHDRSNVKIFRLSRNFGQHPAIMAGLSKAKGDWIVVMDCDLQDQPKEIEKLYNKTLEGFDVVQASRVVRKDGKLKKLGSQIFYKTFNYLAGIEVNNEIANFGIYNRKVIDSVLRIKDQIKFFPLFVNWVGYNSTTISVEHSYRADGSSSYSLAKLISLAFNVIISFSDKPLKIFIGLGTMLSGTSILLGIWIFLRWLQDKISEPGYVSIILSIWFLSGVLMMCLGVVGIYLGKTFNQTKNRPIFIIDEEL